MICMMYHDNVITISVNLLLDLMYSFRMNSLVDYNVNQVTIEFVKFNIYVCFFGVKEMPFYNITLLNKNFWFTGFN